MTHDNAQCNKEESRSYDKYNISKYNENVTERDRYQALTHFNLSYKNKLNGFILLLIISFFSFYLWIWFS